MSLMSWLFSSRTSPKSSGAPAHPGPRRKSTRNGTGGDPTKRKSERAARRELLYAVVREAMVRAGVLSASYKFKVLSLDVDGRQFLIMMDLARGAGGDPNNLAEIEALIAQSAKARHDLAVTAVYWRMNQHVAVGRADARHPPKGTDSQPMQLDSQPAALHAVVEAMVPPAARGPAYEPIQADEVEAFKRALVAGSRPAPLAAVRETGNAHDSDGKGHHGPRSYTLLTGYEDTEMPDTDQKSPLLSGTQYGELR